MPIHTHYFDSKKVQQKSTDSDFVVSLPTLEARSDNPKLHIDNLILEFSYYNVNDNNNTFVVNHTSTDYDITLDNGNYNSVSIITELNSKLDAATGLTWNCSYDSDNGKITYVNTTTEFTLTTNNYNYQYLGFNKSTTKSSSSFTLSADNVNNLAGTRYIDITSQLRGDVSESGNNYSQILARIPCDSVGAFNTIFFNKSYICASEMVYRNISSLSLRLVDEYGLTIDLNGGSVAGSILIDY